MFTFAKGYTVRITPAGLNGYWAEVLRLPGCFSQGDSIADARNKIGAAITLFIKKSKEKSIHIPIDDCPLLSFRPGGPYAHDFIESMVRLGFKREDVEDHAVLTKAMKMITVPLRTDRLAPKLVARLLAAANVSTAEYKSAR